MTILQRLPVEEAVLDEFCRRWRIVKLELFGSMLANPASARDVDLLVTFSPEAKWGCSSMSVWSETLPRSLGGKSTLSVVAL
jgi:predicted nucleotidyltransferase